MLRRWPWVSQKTFSRRRSPIARVESSTADDFRPRSLGNSSTASLPGPRSSRKLARRRITGVIRKNH